MLSFEQDNDLYSMLRIRFPKENENIIFPELKNSAIIREIHTFGKVVPLNKKKSSAKDAKTPLDESEANYPTWGKPSQHQGLGQTLLQKSEQLAKKQGYPKIAVISAIGTRNYYRKFGYKREGLYMTKSL